MKPPLLPREHGTWVMLLVPWVVGCGVARRLGGPELLLLVAVLAGFVAQHQALTWRRLRFAAAPDRAALRAVAALVPLATRRPALVVFAAAGTTLMGAAVLLVHRRVDRALAGQVLAALGLTLTAPAAWYVARGTLDTVAAEVWVLNALFFLGAVFYVRVKIEARSRAARLVPLRARLGFALPMLVLEGGVALAVLALLLTGPLSPLVLLAFVPTGVQTLVGVWRLHRPASLKRVGLLATVHALAFAAIVVGLA